MSKRNLIRALLSKSDLLKGLFRYAQVRSAVGLNSLSPRLYLRLRYRALIGRWPNLADPRGFNEKLIWLNLNWRHPMKSLCADKFTMRSYVANKGFRSLLTDLIGVYEGIDEIDFDALPAKFVLKCSHGCGFNIICKDKLQLDAASAKRKLKRWMKIDFSKRYGELHYAAMKPRIICEHLLEEPDLESPNDYKIYCYNGKIHCVMACTNRTLNSGAVYDFYDPEWKNRLPYIRPGLPSKGDIPKPEAYEDMIAAAAELSKGFPFVRIDFYGIKGKAAIGEMTFTPGGCVDTDLTDHADHTLGGLIELPGEPLK